MHSTHGSRLLGLAALLSIGVSGALAQDGAVTTTVEPGNLTLNAASNTVIEFTNAANDLIQVGGVANLNGTLTLTPLESLRLAQRRTIITAGGGFTGAFASTAVPSSPVLQFTTVQGANTIDVVFNRIRYELLAFSFNQAGPARQLDDYLSVNLTALDALTFALDGQTSGTALRLALEQLHAEPYDAHAQLGLSQAQNLAGHFEQYLHSARMNLAQPETALVPVAAAGPVGLLAPSILSASVVPDPGVQTPAFHDPDQRWGAFGFGYVHGNETETLIDTAGAVERQGFDVSAHGGTIGIDHKVGTHGVIGVTAGSGNLHGDFRDGRGRIDANTWDLGAYGTWTNGHGTYVDGLVNHTNYDFDTLRSVIFTGFAEANRAQHDADATTAYVGAGFMHASGDWSWGPTLSLQWTNLDFDAFAEVGGISALAVAARDVDSVRSQLGVRATKNFEVHRHYTLVPEVRLRWAHEFVNDDRNIVAGFALTPTLTPFTSLAAKRDRDSAYLGASVNAFFKKNISGFLSYDADLGRQGTRVDAGRYGLAVKF